MFTTINQQRSVREQVYEKLKEQIITLVLLPGQILSENEMAMQYGVSRTPIRESFVRLAQEGLVQVLPQRGTHIALIDQELVEEARFMRIKLECAIIELACETFPANTLQQLRNNLQQQKLTLEQENVSEMFRLDQQFHALLFEGTNKLNTWHTMSLLTAHLDRSRKLRLLDNLDWQQIYEQHSRIIEAISQHDATTAIQVLQQHINRGMDDLTELRQKYPQYFVKTI